MLVRVSRCNGPRLFMACFLKLYDFVEILHHILWLSFTVVCAFLYVVYQRCGKCGCGRKRSFTFKFN